jgi:hypothetical protein
MVSLSLALLAAHACLGVLQPSLLPVDSFDCVGAMVYQGYQMQMQAISAPLLKKSMRRAAVPSMYSQVLIVAILRITLLTWVDLF